MRVCHMTSVHDSLDDRIYLKESVSLSEEGYDTYIVARGKSFDQSGVHIIGIGLSDISRFKRMTKLTKKIYEKAIDIDADVYHIHDPELLPSALRLKKKGKVVFFDSHEDIPRQILAKDWIPRPIRLFISKRFENYLRKTSRKLDCIIAATPHIQNVYQKYGAKSVAVRNYPIIEDINISNDDYALREDILCYAGGLTQERGIGELVDISNHMNLKVCLAGNIEDDYREILQKRGANKMVTFEGLLDRKDICKLYGKSKIGMALLYPTPNHVNALAIKLFEYMAAGIPIICSNFPLWKDIVEKNGCGICVDPYNSIEIEKAVRKMLDNPEISKQMGDQGKKVVNEKYNWEIEKEILLNTYRKLAVKK